MTQRSKDNIDPDRAIVGLSNPLGERFEPGTPEAASHPERVRPATPYEQIRDYARDLGLEAQVAGTPTADATELRIVLRRPAVHYAEADPNEIGLAMFLSRYGRLPISEVRSWPADKVSTLASWLGEVLRWELGERTAPQPRLDPKYLGETSRRYQQIFDACDPGDSKPGLSIVDREKFEADLAALNQYLVDEHACTNPDGSPKVGLEAQLGGVPDESGPAAALRLLKLAASRDAFTPLTDHTERRLSGRAIATIAAFVQRHTGMGTAELARMPSTDLLDLADTVLKQDRQQAHEEMSAKMKRRVDQWEEIKDLAAELGLRGKEGQTLPQILREALTGGNDIALLRRLAEDRRVEHNKAAELDQIRDLLNAYGHLKAESTLEQNLRRVVTDLQHWRSFTHRQARRTGAAMPKDGELTAEQAVAHFDLIVTFGRQIADELQQVRDLVLDRQSRMSANASKAVGLLDVLRGLIADAHVPSVDARDMADLRARAEKAEAAHDAAEAQIARIAAPAGQTTYTQVTRTGDGYELHVASIGDLLGEGAYKINVANPATIRRRGDSRDFTVIGCRGYEYDAPLGAGTIYLHPECTGDNFREGTVLKLKT